MYSNLIKEKRAKKIIDFALLQTNVCFPSLMVFLEKGEDILPKPVIDILNEVNHLKHAARIAYEDINRLRNYFEQFIPDYKIDLLLAVVKELDATDYQNIEELKTRFSALKIKASKAIDNYKKAG